MTKLQLLLIFLVGLVSMAAGFVWLFGPFGLIGGGALAVAGSLLLPVRE